MQPLSAAPVPTVANAEPMTMGGSFMAAPDAAADARWLAWTAGNAESDRRSASTMRWLFTIAIGGALGWLVIQALA